MDPSIFRFECAGPRNHDEPLDRPALAPNRQGKLLNINEEIPLLYSSLSRLSGRIDFLQEEQSKAAEAGASGTDHAELPTAVDTMRQELKDLHSAWDTMQAAHTQRDAQWATVQQVLRKFFEQHHFELQQMHEKHRQEVHDQLKPVLAKFDAEKVSDKLHTKFRDELQIAKREFTEFSQAEFTREFSLRSFPAAGPAGPECPDANAALMRMTEQHSFRLTKLEESIKSVSLIGKLNQHALPSALDDINTKLADVTKENEARRLDLEALHKTVDLLKGRHTQLDLMRDLKHPHKVDHSDINLILPSEDMTDGMSPKDRAAQSEDASRNSVGFLHKAYRRCCAPPKTQPPEAG